MSKRNNISYVKPREPTFLRKLKEQIGYKEGPTVDTKREDLGPVRDEDLEDTNEELPTVVVLKSGDLSAEEAAKEKERLEREKAEEPADLSQRIIFKAPTKAATSEQKGDAKSCPSKKTKRPLDEQDRKGDKKGAKKVKNKPLLSFDEEDDDD